MCKTKNHCHVSNLDQAKWAGVDSPVNTLFLIGWTDHRLVDLQLQCCYSCRDKPLQLLQSSRTNFEIMIKPAVTVTDCIFLPREYVVLNKTIFKPISHIILYWSWRSYGFFFNNTIQNQRKPNNHSSLITVCFKDHSLTLLAGRSANIAALLFLLVSIHTSLTTTTSLPDMESSTRQVRPPMTKTRSDTPRNPSYPTPSLYWNKLAPSHSLCSLSCFSSVRANRGGRARAEQEPERQREHTLTTDVLDRIINAILLKFSIG